MWFAQPRRPGAHKPRASGARTEAVTQFVKLTDLDTNATNIPILRPSFLTCLIAAGQMMWPMIRVFYVSVLMRFVRFATCLSLAAETRIQPSRALEGRLY